MFLGAFERVFKGLQKTNLNRSIPVNVNRFFCGLYISKIKRPDRRSSLLWSWSGLVMVFFRSRDRTSKHYFSGCQQQQWSCWPDGNRPLTLFVMPNFYIHLVVDWAWAWHQASAPNACFPFQPQFRSHPLHIPTIFQMMPLCHLCLLFLIPQRRSLKSLWISRPGPTQRHY